MARPTIASLLSEIESLKSMLAAEKKHSAELDAMVQSTSKQVAELRHELSLAKEAAENAQKQPAKREIPQDWRIRRQRAREEYVKRYGQEPKSY